jgi:uncharacterized Fe-S cluster-containing radical SAM superfamily protein
MNTIPALERAVIEIFGGCNYTCKMCPQTTGRGKEWVRKMPFDLFESILDQLPGKPIINLEGSGEATLAKDLPRYIQACTDRGLESYICTNGSRINGEFMNNMIDAGLTYLRVSVIGYDAKSYNQWMNVDNFEFIKENIKETQEYIKKTGSKCKVTSYHLILDNNHTENEVNLYKKNFIEELNITAFIWKLHNWSGNWDPDYRRNPANRKSCGRPFAPELTIRSGGNNGERAAVTPCCQTMGPPNEAKSVLGHFSNQSIEEIYFSKEYKELRSAHEEGRFDDIEYCKNCDFLYDDPEVLVWSNDSDASIDHMIGTKFNLDDYRPKTV